MHDDPAFLPRLCGSCGEVKTTVRNMLCLPMRAPTPGKGWGCVVCGLPADGALTLLCDDCIALDDPPIHFVIDGPAFGGQFITHRRVDAVPFTHDLRKHPPEEEGDYEEDYD